MLLIKTVLLIVDPEQDRCIFGHLIPLKQRGFSEVKTFQDNSVRKQGRYLTYNVNGLDNEL